MKKLLTITLFLITIFCQSQTIRTTYRACPKYTYVKFDGSYQAYLNAIYLSGYTTSSVAYSPTELVFPSGLTLPKSWYVYYDSVTYDLAYRDSVMFTNMFNEDQRYVYPPYIANTDGYARMIDTVGGSGNNKIIPTAFFINSITKINDSISNKYTKAVADNRFVSLTESYSNPNWLLNLPYSKITGTPTTLVGYGITDGVTSLSLTSGLAGKENSISSGTTAQFWIGNKTWLGGSANQMFRINSAGTALEAFTPSFLTGNQTITLSGSITGSGTTSITTKIIYGSPSAGNSITSGTAFQPRSGGACDIVINSSLGSGLAAVTGTVTIAMSSTQNGTYTTVATDGLILSLLNASLDRSSATIPVPEGWWVKVTYTVTGVGAALTGTYTKWDK